MKTIINIKDIIYLWWLLEQENVVYCTPFCVLCMIYVYNPPINQLVQFCRQPLEFLKSYYRKPKNSLPTSPSRYNCFILFCLNPRLKIVHIILLSYFIIAHLRNQQRKWTLPHTNSSFHFWFSWTFNRQSFGPYHASYSL